MYNKIENLLDQFYKTYYKIEEINLNQVIKCLTTTEIHVIEAIGQDKITMNELAEKLGITMGTASIAINKLNEKQFIERIRSDEDRRKVFVKLSKKGEMALNYHGNFHSTILEKITENITCLRQGIKIGKYEIGGTRLMNYLNTTYVDFNSFIF